MPSNVIYFDSLEGRVLVGLFALTALGLAYMLLTTFLPPSVPTLRVDWGRRGLAAVGAVARKGAAALRRRLPCRWRWLALLVPWGPRLCCCRPKPVVSYYVGGAGLPHRCASWSSRTATTK